MESGAKKSLWLQGIKTGVFSLVFACIGVLVLALIAKLCNLPEHILPAINQVLKGISLLLGVLFFVKEEKFLFKSLLGAGVFWVLSVVLFSLLGGQFHWGQIFLDLGVALVVAVVTALFKGRRA